VELEKVDMEDIMVNQDSWVLVTQKVYAKPKLLTYILLAQDLLHIQSTRKE
jgi:hypothetical protein